MTAAVVDENVPIVANDVARIATNRKPLAPQASNKCRLAAVRFLRDQIANGVIVIDNGGACLSKYRKRLSGKGQPGVGDAFLRHLSDNAYNSARVEQVELQEIDGEYCAFPDDVSLETFDHDDRIFVALALSSALTPQLINAADSDYRQHARALAKAGVVVNEICDQGKPVASTRKRKSRLKGTRKK